MPSSTVSFNAIKEKSVQGRYVTLEHLQGFLKKCISLNSLQDLGKSVQGRSIPCITLGGGYHKVLMWSQMHGNESTTTKAVLDLINYLNEGSNGAKDVLKNCTIKIIPILNPDGAYAYTRANANEIDLNRDARDLTQPESVVLRELFEDFGPDYCFNLHDQRTIYNVGSTAKPATVSFLAPAHDEKRSISQTRAKSMQLIVAINKVLQQKIPGQVGRYDDAFNPNCVGDSFQIMDTPTILFEAGHFPEDYEREETREYIFHALLAGLKAISTDSSWDTDLDDYFAIAENNKLFYDVLISKAHFLNSQYGQEESVGVLYEEALKGDTITFQPKIEKRGNLEGHFGHITYDCSVPQDLIKLKENKEIFDLLF